MRRALHKMLKAWARRPTHTRTPLFARALVEFQHFTAAVGDAAVSFLPLRASDSTAFHTSGPGIVLATAGCSVEVDGFSTPAGPVFGRLLSRAANGTVHGCGQRGHICVIELEPEADIDFTPEARLRANDSVLPIPASLLVSSLLTFQLSFAPKARRASDEWPAIDILLAAWRSLAPLEISPAVVPLVFGTLREVAWSPFPPFDPAELARRVGVTRGDLLQTFRRELGLSLPAYRKQLRIRMAACVLLETPISIANLAEAFGYGSGSQFKDDFASVFQLTPSRLISALTAQLIPRAGF